MKSVALIIAALSVVTLGAAFFRYAPIGPAEGTGAWVFDRLTGRLCLADMRVNGSRPVCSVEELRRPNP